MINAFDAVVGNTINTISNDHRLILPIDAYAVVAMLFRSRDDLSMHVAALLFVVYITSQKNYRSRRVVPGMGGFTASGTLKICWSFFTVANTMMPTRPHTRRHVNAMITCK